MMKQIAEPKVTDTKLKATPEQEDFAHKYTEEGSGKIGSRLLDNYFKNVATLIDGADLPTGKLRAIELGCGEGFSTKRLADILPKNVTLDASEYVAEMIPRARKLNPGVTITEESVYELKHKDNSYDVIFLLEVLEHLDFPDQALKEIYRILKPGGILILGVPREPIWCCLNLARGKYIRHFGNTVGHLNHWSTITLRRYLRKHFAPVEATRTPIPWTIVRVRIPL